MLDTKHAYLNTEYVKLWHFPPLYNKFIYTIKIIGDMNDHTHYSHYTSLTQKFIPSTEVGNRKQSEQFLVS